MEEEVNRVKKVGRKDGGRMKEEEMWRRSMKRQREKRRVRGQSETKIRGKRLKRPFRILFFPSSCLIFLFHN